MNFSIPSSIDLLGSTWKVKKTKDLRDSEGQRCDGLCHTAIRLIEIDAEIYSDRDRLEHTLLHELTHAILDVSGHHELSSNEESVDLISGLAHQVIKSWR